MNRNILVTGGTGFIGSHTVVVLLEAGYDAVIYDNLSNSKASVVDRIERIAGRRPGFVEGDVLDAAALKGLFKTQDFDAVIHFAGLKAVGESVAKPWAYYQTNVAGSLNLYKAMAAADVKNMIFSSSATVYGAGNPVPYTEDMPLSAPNPYGWTKLMNEQILRDICAADPAWSVALLRYFNPGGAHESGLIGEDPNGVPNNLLPYVSKVATGELERVNIFGDDYDTPDGTGLRDYIHVMDLARGHVLALEYINAGLLRCARNDRDDTDVRNDRDDTGARNDRDNTFARNDERGGGVTAINIGTGKATSVREVIAAFEKACGREIPAAVGPRRAGDLAATYADVRLAKELLGFETRQGIDEICADAWRWQRYAAGLNGQ